MAELSCLEHGAVWKAEITERKELAEASTSDIRVVGDLSNDFHMMFGEEEIF